MNTTLLDIQEKVIEELAYDPRFDAEDIGVSVKEGVVTLRGTVANLNEKWNVEEAVKRVKGVRGIVDDLVVDLPGTHARTDTDIAIALEHRLASNPMMLSDVTFVVQDACVTLTGQVRWQYQAQEAVAEARRVTGVREVANLISIKPSVFLSANEIRSRIRSALERTANLEADHITVAVSDGTVTLGGSVRTWLDCDNAARAAWSLPGVGHVENRIVVQP